MIAHRLDLPARRSAGRRRGRGRGSARRDPRGDRGRPAPGPARRGGRGSGRSRLRDRLAGLEGDPRPVEQDGRVERVGGRASRRRGVVAPQARTGRRTRRARRARTGRCRRRPARAGRRRRSAPLRARRQRRGPACGPGWRSSNRTPTGPSRVPGLGRPDRAALHAGEDRIERAVGRSIARPASRRASLGRPRAACASAAITSPSDVVRMALEPGRRGLAGPDEVAGPPAGLGEVADRVVVEVAAAGQRLELGPGEASASRAGGGSGPGTRSGGADRRRTGPDRGAASRRRRHAGSRRRRFEAAQVAGRRDDRQPQALVAEQLAGQALDRRRRRRRRPRRAPRRASGPGRGAPPGRRSTTRGGASRPSAARGRPTGSALAFASSSAGTELVAQPGELDEDRLERRRQAARDRPRPRPRATPASA